jgi:phosphonate transport system substrate-binding protein
LGAVNFQVWDSELAAGTVDTSKVQVVWQTPPYPDYQWTVRGDVDQRFGAGFKEKLTKVLIAMKDPELLATFPRSGFIPASNADFEPIAKTAKQLNLLD